MRHFSLKESWRLDASSRSHARIVRYARRTVATFLVIGLAIWLTYLLLRPFQHPNTYMMFLASGQYQPLEGTPDEFVFEDFSQFADLESAFAHSASEENATSIEFASIDSRNAVAKQFQRARELELRASDTLLLYVRANGVVLDGVPYLKCGNFRAANLLEGLYPLAELLREIQLCPGGTKVLFLDAQHTNYDPHAGTIGTSFVHLLEQQMQDVAKEASIWVLASCNPWEESHSSRAVQQSVFGLMLADGLRGRADLNEDRTIDLRELTLYVREGVSGWVHDWSDGNLTQTPTLYGGDFSLLNQSPPVLLSVAGLPVISKTESAADTIRNAHAPKKQTVVERAVVRHGNLAIADASSRATREIGSKYGAVLAARRVGRRAMASASDTKTSTPSGSEVAEVASGEPATDGKVADEEDSASPSEETPAATTASPSPTEGPTGTEDETPAQEVDEAARREAEQGMAAGQAATLLTEGWALHEQLSKRTTGRENLLDLAPDLWRRLQDELLWYEQLQRAGSAPDQVPIVEKLGAIVAQLRSLAAGLPAAAARPRHVADEMAANLPQTAIEVSKLHSLELAEWLVWNREREIDPQLRATSTALDVAIDQEQDLAFRTWLEENGGRDFPNIDRFAWARYLATRRDVPWRLQRLAIATRKLGDQVAAHPACAHGWLRASIESADRFRVQAERELIDRTESAWLDLAEQHFTAVQQQYRSVRRQLDEIQHAIELTHDLLNQAPYFLKWRFLCGAEELGSEPTYRDLQSLLVTLHTMKGILSTPDDAQLPNLVKRFDTLRMLQERLSRGLTPERIQSLIASPVSAGDSWRAETLLATPLLDTDSRILLLAETTQLDAQIVSRFSFPRPPAETQVTRGTRWQQGTHLVQQLRLEVALAELTSAASQAKHVAWKSKLRQLQADLAIASGDHADESWRCIEEINAGLKSLYAELPVQIETVRRQNADLSDFASRPERLRQLHAAYCDLFLIDGRNALPVTQVSLWQQLRDATSYDFLNWHSDRFTRAAADAPPADRLAYLDSAHQYRRMAMRIPRQPVVFEPIDTDIQLDGPASVSMIGSSEQEVTLRIQRGANSPGKAWIVLDYDDTAIQVETQPGIVVYQRKTLVAQLQRYFEMAVDRASSAEEPGHAGLTNRDSDITLNAAKRAVQYPLRPDLCQLPPTFQLESGDARDFRLKIRHIGKPSGSCKLVVKAMTDTARTELDTGYLRHEVNVQLPGGAALRLVVDGNKDRWSEASEGVMLHPLPNRPEDFRFSLINQGFSPLSISAQIVVPESDASIVLPQDGLTQGQAREILKHFGGLKTLLAIDRLDLHGGDQPIALRAELPPDTSEESGTSSQSPKPAADSPPADVPALPTPNGLLLVLTDLNTQEQQLRRIQVAPQRPRRFVQARVDYNSERERIEVEVTPRVPDDVPAGGILVECEFHNVLDSTQPIRTAARIQAPNYAAKLFASVPLEQKGDVTTFVHVDGYPRAFLYHVPCHAGIRNVPEWADATEIRIVHPLPGKVVAAPTQGIPARVEVDAPLGSFPYRLGHDFVEIGLDVDRDRELSGDPALRFTTDRQVRVALRELNRDGNLSLEAKVTDFDLAIPSMGFQNVRVNVLGRMVAGDRTTWSRPSLVILDGVGPKVERVELLPGRTVATGKPLKVSVWTNDGQLSSTTGVELAFDRKGSGEITPESQPVKAEQVSPFRWLAEVPTDGLLGQNTLLLRATDLAGNIGPIKKLVVNVASAEESDPKYQSNEIAGVVAYGKLKLAGAVIQLAALPAKPIRTLTTGEDGKFLIRNVPPGDYTLTAEGLARNRPRFATLEINVPKPPAAGPQLDVQVR